MAAEDLVGPIGNSVSKEPSETILAVPQIIPSHKIVTVIVGKVVCVKEEKIRQVVQD